MYVGASAPTADDDVTLDYDIGSIWIDNTVPADPISYICVDNTEGYAIWKRQSDAVPTDGNKDMTAEVTDAAVHRATATALAATPSGGGFIQVAVNGKIVSVGGVAKDKDCFFTGNGGTDARAIGAAVAGDELYWVRANAEYSLDADDRIDFFYNV